MRWSPSGPRRGPHKAFIRQFESDPAHQSMFESRTMVSVTSKTYYVVRTSHHGCGNRFIVERRPFVEKDPVGTTAYARVLDWIDHIADTYPKDDVFIVERL